MKFMKYTILASVLCCLALSSFSQNRSLLKGEKQLKKFEFPKAIKHYQKALKRDESLVEPKMELAKIYRLTNDPVQAEYWYAQFIDDPNANVTPQQIYNYAQALRVNEKYDTAGRYYRKYADLIPDDKRGLWMADACANIHLYKADSNRYSIINLPFNSPYSEFSPAYFEENESIVFPSARQSGTTISKTDVWSGSAFLDLYVSEKDPGGNLQEPKVLPGKPNQKFHEGPATFTQSWDEMYFTRNNYVGAQKKKIGDEGIMKLKVVRAVLKDDKWEISGELPFNSDDYSVGHPAMTKDGKTIYFASDLADDGTGQDLYKTILEDSMWSEPIRLAGDINTRGDEVFPFIHPDGTLYFASDGHPGIGGLDVFSAEKSGDNWGNITNLGYKINTSWDDFGLIFDEEKAGGYFSSNRPSGVGSDDIYEFKVKGLTLKGLVYDKETGDPIPGASVSVLLEGTEVNQVITNPEGKFEISVDKDTEYQLDASKPGYLPNSHIVNTTGLTPESPEERIPLTPEKKLMLSGVVLDKHSRAHIPGATVYLKNTTTGGIDSTTSGPSGDFTFGLEPSMNYNLTAQKANCVLSKDETFTTAGMTEGTIDKVLEMTCFLAGQVIHLKNIYYDLDKYNIRPDAARELEQVVEWMKQFPKLTIEMRSHCDSRASYTYNIWLSAKRAESSSNYIISRNVAPERITAAGFGEYLLVNECVGEPVDVPEKDCSEEKHQLNRRTEFKVLTQPDGITVLGTVD